MNSAEYVDKLIEKLKKSGENLQDAAWKVGLACVGWAYIYGARGQECTPSYRRSAFNSHGDDHTTIQTACKNFDGSGKCSGCKWYPNNKRTRTYDCRGFTYWILKQVYGWELKGAGATSQWNTAENWTAKGPIETMPENVLCCLFYRKKDDPKKMAHTGFGLNNETVECSSGVQHFTKRNAKWEYWAVPKCVSGEVTPTPAPEPEPEPTPEPGTAIVTGKQVALRKGPTTSAGIITRIATGKVVRIATPPADWEYVEFNGKKGYMMKKYLNEG